nr:RNA-directed DNA polymerase, eukaryota [Tanacetum cinerariifolium]
MHLYANVARFERLKNPLPRNPNSSVQTGRPSQFSSPGVAKQPNVHTGSYANVVNRAHGSLISSSPALVLDDSCLADRDLSRHVMGKVKDFTFIPNLHTILDDEGFSGAKLTYLGGTWVMIEFDKVDTKEHLMKHTGVNSWFLIKDVIDDFFSEDRIVWVDIEGVPLNAWSRETFVTIGNKWDETLDLEDNTDISFGRKRVCIKTKHATSILESFKIIVKEDECTSDVESVHEPLNNNVNDEEYGDEYASDVNEVPETVFGANSSSNTHPNGPKDEQQSKDLFGLYDLLNKKKAGEISEPSPFLSHPPGYTSEVMNSSQEVPIEDHNEQVGQNGVNNGGSVFGVIEDVIRVGQAMGHSMEGCVNDLVAIIGKQGEDNVFR